MKTSLLVIVCLGYIISVQSAELYQQCTDSKAASTDLSKAVLVSNCRKTYCRLKKGTKSEVQIKFTPPNDVKTLLNSVEANIAGIPFPFIGVHGTSACNNIYDADGTTKVPCPLKGGTEYIYKATFDILPVYPTLKLVVHWALNDPSYGDVSCFRVPAKITN